MSRPLLVLMLAFLAGTAAAQEPLPLLICPPKFSAPIFVPVEELLQGLPDARTTAWIVRDKPVADCVVHYGDAATRHYEDFVRPLQTREYYSQVRLLTAEIEALERHLAHYRSFNHTDGLMVTIDSTELALMATRERLRNLRYERALALRHQTRERELRSGVPVLP